MKGDADEGLWAVRFVVAGILAAAAPAAPAVAAETVRVTFESDYIDGSCGFDLLVHSQVAAVDIGVPSLLKPQLAVGHVDETDTFTNTFTGTTLVGRRAVTSRAYDWERNLDETLTGTISFTLAQDDGDLLVRVPGVGLVVARVGHRLVRVTTTYFQDIPIDTTTVILDEAGRWDTEGLAPLCAYLSV